MLSPLIIGHRGASAVAPENTLAAFARALRDGADGIEFDVRLARDGVPVVIHDANLRRTGLREGAIANLSSTELGKIDVGTWFNLRDAALAHDHYSQATVPNLAQVFAMLSADDSLLYVEMKCEPKESGALAAEVVQLIRECSFYDRAIVKSFALDSLAEVKRIDPRIRTAALFDRKLTRPAPLIRTIMEQALRCGADEISLHHTLVTRRFVEAARQHGMSTVVWTVDSPSWVRRAIDYGVHALITNNPARLRAQCDQLLTG